MPAGFDAGGKPPRVLVSNEGLDRQEFVSPAYARGSRELRLLHPGFLRDNMFPESPGRNAMKTLLAAAGSTLLLLAPAGIAQSPPPAAAAQGDVSRRIEGDINNLRREVERLSKQVEALTRAVADITNQLVTSVQINAVTDYFGAGQSNLQPKVISSYPGRLVSANVTLVRTEREGAQTFTIERSVVITPGGSVPMAVEGADVLCNWVIYDEANAIKVRSDGCTYLARGLRGYFTGAAYYRR
jgi:hypothetical protein